MNSTNDNAVNVAKSYVEAIKNKDVESILAISADDVMCTSPLGQTKGVESFRAFHDGFARMTTKMTILAVYGDDKQAVVVYEVETHPVPHSIVAELIKVTDGKIATTDVIYDAAPFASFMATIHAK